MEPAEGLKTLQQEAAMVRVRLWDGSTPWLVTRHAEQCALLSDKRVAADWNLPGYPFLNEFAREHHREASFLTVMDNPDHARIRRMVTPGFRKRKIERLRPLVRQIVDATIDSMLEGENPTNLVQKLAIPIPTIVICHELGVPYEDHDFFQDAVKILTNRDEPNNRISDAERRLYRYLLNLLHTKALQPQDDLLSDLVVNRYGGGEMNRHELVMLVLFLLVSGHETTATMISLGTLVLLNNPQQKALLRDATPEETARAVEEMLRYLTTVLPGRRRVATADIEISGFKIRAGEGLILPEEIGNRDPRVFDDPDRLDLTRDAHKQLSFGFGPHQCAGQTLARMELQTVFQTLFKRVPTLDVSKRAGAVEFLDDGIGYGLRNLEVTW